MVLTQTTPLRAYGEGALWTHFILVAQHRLHFQHCPCPWVGGCPCVVNSLNNHTQGG